MKRFLLCLVCVIVSLSLFSCSQEKVEGDALERYLEIIDSLDCGVVKLTSQVSKNKATVSFRQGEKGCELLAVTTDGEVSFTNYFDGERYFSGSESLEEYDGLALDAVTLKRNLVGAPDYAIDPEFYDAQKSGIYKTLLGYKIVIVTHDEPDAFTYVPETRLTLYLDSDMKPKKAVIEDEVVSAEGIKKVYKTTLVYKSIGTEPDFVAPTVD